ncbi:MAG: hypothetical protein ACFFCQ_01610 [Promethearchaeota archaeon]
MGKPSSTEKENHIKRCVKKISAGEFKRIFDAATWVDYIIECKGKTNPTDQEAIQHQLDVMKEPLIDLMISLIMKGPEPPE